MYVKAHKLKLLSKNNYLTEKGSKNILYPTLNNNFKSFDRKFLNTNINSANKRKINNKKQYIRTSSAFLDRNYKNYLVKLTQKNGSINRKVLQKHQLNSLLYKLKNYHSELIMYNKKKDKSLKLLNDNLKKEQLKFQKMQDLQDIDLPEEKISIKNFNEIKLSKEDMEKKLHLLIEEKQKIEYSLKSEEEYNRTIEYMLENEQNKLFSIKKESYNIEDKIKNINKYQKIIKYNMNINDKEEEKIQELNKEISNDFKLAQKMEDKQNLMNEKLQIEKNEKENEVRKLQEIVDELKAYENTNLKFSKDELKNKIEDAKGIEMKRINNEKKCIEIIYCLYIIQKYLYEDKDFDKNKILQSYEYQLLKQLNDWENVIIKPESKGTKREDNKNKNESNYNKERELLNKESKIQTFSKISSSKKNKNPLSTDNTLEDSKFNKTTKNFHHKIPNNETVNSSHNNKTSSFKKTETKTQLSLFKSYSDLITFYSDNTNNLNELLGKFKSIKITKNEILDFISQLLSKLDFYGSQMNYLHFKELNLEDVRSNYDKKVKEIISNNYFNFEELTKNNPRFKEFFEKNEYFISKMKKNNNKILMDKIIEKINKKNDIIELEENINKNDNNEENNDINEDNILFKSSKNIIRSVKNFFLICSDLLKNIIHIIISKNSNINSNDKKFMSINKLEDLNEALLKNNISEDKNRFIQTYKKLDEFQKNEEIIIGEDYKLLLQYIKNLIKYCRENDGVIPEEDFDDINSNLVDKFYIQGEFGQKIDIVFMKRFIAKDVSNYNNIFIHLTTLSNQVFENIKEIYDLIHSEENKKYLEDSKELNKFSEEDIYNNNLNLLSPKRFSQASINNNESQSIEGRNSKSKSKRKYKLIKSAKTISIKSTNINDKFRELCVDDEDNADKETQSTKKIIIKKKRRAKSIDEKIINKLYTPFLEKTTYLRKLNSNIPGIKQMTTSNSKTYHNIRKRIGEVNTISYQMKIYNNPHLDTNKLCNDTYNSLVKLINDNIYKKKHKRPKFRISEN